MHVRRHPVRALVLSALLLAACAPSGAPGAAPAKPASGAPAPAAPGSAGAAPAASAPAAPTTPPAPTTIDLGVTSPLAVYWIEFVAFAKGYYAAEGLNPEIVLTESSVRATQALSGGSLDVSMHSPDSAIVAVEKGANLVITGVTVSRPVYSVMAHPSVTTLQDLRGKKVAVSDLKSGATLILLRTLRHGGVAESEVDLIPSGGTSARYAAMKSGAVTAAAMLQPDDFRAMDDGFRRVAISTDAVPDYTFNSVIVRRDWARDHADTLVRYLRAVRRAAAWLYDPANRDEAIAILMERTKVEEKYARATYDLSVVQAKIYEPQIRPNAPGIQAVIDVLAETGELTAPLPAPDKYIDYTYWERSGT